LARKAGAVRGNLAGWLYAVAVRTARGVRLMRDRRRRHELLASPERERGELSPDPDLAAVIDEELARLPEHYRAVGVLCELRGLRRRVADRRPRRATRPGVRDRPGPARRGRPGREARRTARRGGLRRPRGRGEEAARTRPEGRAGAAGGAQVRQPRGPRARRE